MRLVGVIDTWRFSRRGGAGYGFVVAGGHRYFLPGKNLSDADREKVTVGKSVEFDTKSPTGPDQCEVAVGARILPCGSAGA